MKTLVAMFVALSSTGVFATVTEVGTIEQPINLGAKADPKRIPLGPVVVETNHGYGRHPLITTPRPCAHGALVWEDGQELDMNLASAFGIEVVPEDETQVPQMPVTLKVKSWTVPAYSPYRKDQVLSAVLHCLLRSVHATPKTPLRIIIDAESPEDFKNLQGFAGSYVTAEAEEEGGPTPVPGTSLTTDERGVTYVVWTDRVRGIAGEAPQQGSPVMIPFHHYDDTDDNFFEFIPVWTGDNWKKDQREIIAQPVLLFHDLFDQARSYGPDINALSKLDLLQRCRWTDQVDGIRLEVALNTRLENLPEPEMVSRSVAALCHAAILTTLPSDSRPLTIEIEVPPTMVKGPLAAFAEHPAWKVREGRQGRTRTLTCSFTWDADGRKLIQGFVPVGRLEFQLHRPWTLRFPLVSE